MDNQNFRHEWKHRINQADCAVLHSRLRALLQSDCHAGYQGCYLVRSLYFDNPDDLVLREKLDGVRDRDKFRIRFYNYDLSFINLEKKSKRGNLCQKLSAPLSPEQAARLSAGDWRWLAKADAPLLRELYLNILYKQLRPRTVVDYTREAFVYPVGNVRITLDTGIRTGLDAVDFLNPQLPTVPAAECAALEIKYDSCLPDFIRSAVQLDSRNVSAFSKYAAARLY